MNFQPDKPTVHKITMKDTCVHKITCTFVFDCHCYVVFLVLLLKIPVDQRDMSCFHDLGLYIIEIHVYKEYVNYI